MAPQVFAKQVVLKLQYKGKKPLPPSFASLGPPTLKFVAWPLPSYRTEISRNSISSRGPVLWNSLSKEMKNSTIETFKKHLKYERKKINTISFSKGTGQFIKKDSDSICF